MKKYWFIVIGLLLILFDLYYAVASWQDIRNQLGWVKHIPQKTEFKIRHIVQFTPQTIFFFLGLSKKYKFSWQRASVWAFLIVFGVGITSEAIQFFIPTRIATLQDVFWNAVAAILGVIIGNVCLLIEKKRSKF